MSDAVPFEIDPRLDLVLERVVDAAPGKVWAAWTRPEHLKRWFTPAPWKTTECEIDLRPGGVFRTVMRSPEGKDYPNLGCYLEVVPERRLVWTEALLPGFRPAPENPDASCGGLVMTGAILLEPRGKGTRYTAVALHRDPETRKKHEEMGFHEGWGKALDQLLEVVRGM